MENLNNLRNTVTDDISKDVTTNISQSVTEQMVSMLSWILIPALLVALVLVIIFVVRAIRRYHLEKAIFEIRDSVREIKLSQDSSQTTPTNPVVTETTIPPQDTNAL